MADIKADKAGILQALQQKFIDGLPVRLAEIAADWQRVCEAGEDAQAFDELTRRVHSLAGSAGTFQYFKLGERARDLENLLHQHRNSPREPQLQHAIATTLGQLNEVAAEGPDRPVVPSAKVAVEWAVAEAESRLVYLLEDDQDLAAEAVRQLQHFGYRLEVFHDTVSLREAMVRQAPQVLVADIQLPEGRRAGPDAVKAIRTSLMNDIPIMFLSAHDSWQDRLDAVQAGGQAYLTKPINFTQLVEQMDGMTGKSREKAYRILIVDDSRLLAEHYAAVLESVGMVTRVIEDPSCLLELLPEFTPDLILMDLYMPGCTGVEAATVIRQLPTYTSLPIVYLSTEKGLQQQLEALQVGGDAFLQKPIMDAHLVTAVRIRARRFRDLNALMIRDSLTGLLNHINLKLTLDRQLSQAKRRGAILTYAMLDIDHFKSINDRYGHPVGDRVIKSLARLLSQRLRKGDIAARYGGEEFALVLPDTPVKQARRLLDELRQNFSEISFAHDTGDFRATFSAGIAVVQPQQDMEALIAAADNALYQAKHAGRNRVVVDGGAGTG